MSSRQNNFNFIRRIEEKSGFKMQLRKASASVFRQFEINLPFSIYFLVITTTIALTSCSGDLKFGQKKKAHASDNAQSLPESNLALKNQPSERYLIGQEINYVPVFSTDQNPEIAVAEVQLTLVQSPSDMELGQDGSIVWSTGKIGSYDVEFNAKYKNLAANFKVTFNIYQATDVLSAKVSAKDGATLTLSAPGTVFDGGEILIPPGVIGSDTTFEVKLLAGPSKAGFKEIKLSGDPQLTISPYLPHDSQIKLKVPSIIPQGFEAGDFVLTAWVKETKRLKTNSGGTSPVLQFFDVIDKSLVSNKDVQKSIAEAYVPGYVKKEVIKKGDFAFAYLLEKGMSADLTFIDERFAELSKALASARSSGCDVQPSEESAFLVVIGAYEANALNGALAFVSSGVMYLDRFMDVLSMTYSEVVSHEFFHVVQDYLLGKNYSYELMRWWIESSAEDFSMTTTGTKGVIRARSYSKNTTIPPMTTFGFSQSVLDQVEEAYSGTISLLNYGFFPFFQFLKAKTGDKNLICRLMTQDKAIFSNGLIPDLLRKTIAIPFNELYMEYGQAYNIKKDTNIIPDIIAFDPNMGIETSFEYPKDPKEKFKKINPIVGYVTYKLIFADPSNKKVAFHIKSITPDVPWNAAIYDQNNNYLSTKDCNKTVCYIDSSTAASNYPTLENNTTYFVSVGNIDFPKGKSLAEVQRQLKIQFEFEEESFSSHSCAIINGGARCWGNNENGQLGNSTTIDSTSPVAVHGVNTGVIAIGAGRSHSCALASGAVKCWGKNNYGQLGNGQAVGSAVAVQVKGLEKDVTSISVGGNHNCAVLRGAVVCWGDNSQQQIGNLLLASAYSNIPLSVEKLTTGVRQISAGGAHTCALINNNLRCWGSNDRGQIGIIGNLITAAKLPTAVQVTEDGFRSVSAGGNHTCAVTISGHLYCFGDNSKGQLGLGNVDAQAPSGKYALPREVPMISLGNGGNSSDVQEVFAGNQHTCALREGSLYCWGDNSSGQLADPGLVPIAQATLIDKLGKNVQSASTNSTANHTCALVLGAVQCWGNNVNGGLGNGNIENSSQPVPAQGLTPLDPKKLGDIVVNGLTKALPALSVGGTKSCLLVHGRVQCWGNSWGQTQARFPNETPPTKEVFDLSAQSENLFTATLMSSKDQHDCMIAAGTIYCWGNNYYGQSIAVPSSQQDNYEVKLPTKVQSIPAGIVQDIALGDWHGCAIISGKQYCWGVDYDDTVTIRPPSQIGGLSDPVYKLGGGCCHACAITNLGTVKCFYANNTGQLGDPNVTTFSSVSALTVSGISGGATAVTAGTNHTCALVDSKAICWGHSSYGELGFATADRWTYQGQEVTALGSGVQSIAAGNDYTCALTNGDVYCFGAKNRNAVSATADITAPTKVPNLPNGIIDISTGYGHGCAYTGSEVYCWGNDNSYGSVTGSPSGGVFPTPVKVGL